MDNLYVAPTPSSPEVDFNFEQHRLSLRGESYPENAAAFYGELLKQMRSYLAGCTQQRIVMNIALAYFNSSSTKMLFNLIEALDEAVSAGNEVVLNWFHDEEDDTILEFGEELSTDFPSITFVNQSVKTA